MKKSAPFLLRTEEGFRVSAFLKEDPYRLDMIWATTEESGFVYHTMEPKVFCYQIKKTKF